MWKIILIMVGLATTGLYAQEPNEALKKTLEQVKTVNDAKVLLKDRTVKGAVRSFASRVDTSAMGKAVLAGKVGEVLQYTWNDSTVSLIKILSFKLVTQYRVRYIYLDSRRLSKSAIDSLRMVIMEKLKKGERFEDLATAYSMDGNAAKGGLLGWFYDGQMIKTFEHAVKSHALNEVYLVDMPDQNWYYTVKNTDVPVQGYLVEALEVWGR